MPSTLQSAATIAAFAAPLSLLLAGLTPADTANRRGPRMAHLANGVAWLAFVFALIALVTHGFGPAQSLTRSSVGLPFDLGAFALGVYVDAVTVIMLTLVSLVGALVSTYARNYMNGDPNEGISHKWMLLTLAAILTLIVSGNLLMFSLAWIATSLCLHQLLVFYRERPAAIMAAHKKFIFSRIGDASLLAATLLIGSSLHTLDISGVYAAMASMDGPLPPALQ